jgi:hypothetical protein
MGVRRVDRSKNLQFDVDKDRGMDTGSQRTMVMERSSVQRSASRDFVTQQTTVIGFRTTSGRLRAGQSMPGK